jgi:hypothetical protein
MPLDIIAWASLGTGFIASSNSSETTRHSASWPVFREARKRFVLASRYRVERNVLNVKQIIHEEPVQGHASERIRIPISIEARVLEGLREVL